MADELVWPTGWSRKGGRLLMSGIRLRGRKVGLNVGLELLV